MSVPFKTISSINPGGLTLSGQYDAAIVYSGGRRFDVLMVLIIQAFTLNYQWMGSVLGRFIEVIQQQLTHGRPLKPGVSGTLSRAVRETVVTINNVDSTKGSVTFVPVCKFRKMPYSLDFEKMADPPAAADSATATATVIPIAGTPSELSG